MAKILPVSKLPKGKKPTFTKKHIPTNVTPAQGGATGVGIGVTAKKFKPGKQKP